MKPLSEIIFDSWRATLDGCARLLPGFSPECESIAFRGDRGECAVAIPVSPSLVVNEEFNAVKLQTRTLVLGGVNKTVICLESNRQEPTYAFAALCGEFLFSGEDGRSRAKLVADPISWWREWKELIGNKDVNLRVYDVLGELRTLLFLAEHKNPAGLSWRGPDASSYDIHTNQTLYEVKSTLARSNRRIVVHNRFQLDAGNLPLSIILCAFEASPSGVSIDDVVDEIVDRQIMEREVLESVLTRLGYAAGRAARKERFFLHAMEEYVVDESFPRFEELPVGVVDLEFTVELSSFQGVRLI